ncbi:hypothetical protein JCM6882_006981 [Rhodosporidiobolus microsporus]
MGLFSHNKKHTSPSGFFTTDESDAHHKQRTASDSPRKSTSSTTDEPRTSADAGRKSVDAAREERAEGGSKVGAAAAGAGTAAAAASRGSHDKAEEERESALPLTGTGAAGGRETSHIGGAEAVPTGVPPGAAAAPSAPSTTQDVGMSAAPAPAAAAATSASMSSRKPVPRASLDSAHSTTTSGAGVGEQLPKHGHGHGHHSLTLSKDAILDAEQAKRAEHDHRYLEAVVHERRHVHEVEEVERHRVVDRHVHHVQHHVQPLLDERHLEVVHSYREVPVMHVSESHASSPADAALLARLNAQSASTYTVVPHERVVIDKGETQVVQNVINHYHSIILPVWQKDLHEYYRLASDFTSPPTAPSSHPNTASPSVQAGAVPLQPSMMGPAQPREGHMLVPDHGKAAATYEVEYVNREPVVPGRGVADGFGGAAVAGKGHSHHHASSSLTHPHSHIPATVGGDAPSAAEHYPAGAQGVPVREATGLSGMQGTQGAQDAQGARAMEGMERGVEQLGVAK